MGIRGGKQLPVQSAQATRVAFGALTFLLWYVAMLLGMSVVAVLTVRTFRDVKATVLALSAMTACLWGLRRFVRQAFVPEGPRVPALQGGSPAEKH
jgi:hypothetical protein